MQCFVLVEDACCTVAGSRLSLDPGLNGQRAQTLWWDCSGQCWEESRLLLAGELRHLRFKWPESLQTLEAPQVLLLASRKARAHEQIQLRGAANACALARSWRCTPPRSPWLRPLRSSSVIEARCVSSLGYRLGRRAAEAMVSTTARAGHQAGT